MINIYKQRLVRDIDPDRFKNNVLNLITSYMTLKAGT
jgi:hypothetical protein